ncbi:MAG TPA: succinylglutamate desuccinylase/aspartoacylase family protein [Gammaproteobacteria bacterium]|nr:succinylglutamate desuccinylase/aspartoacylase family protein [Gammaproteobacteria bacterium]
MSRLACVSAAAICFAPGWLAAGTEETEQPANATVAAAPAVRDEPAPTDVDEPAPADMDEAAPADGDEAAPPDVGEAEEDGDPEPAEDAAAQEPAPDAAAAPESPPEPSPESRDADSPQLPVPAGDTVTTAEPEAVTAPVADEEGVLPGEPGDEPGVGLPAAAPVPADETVPLQETGKEEPAQEAGAQPTPAPQDTIFLLGTEVPRGAIDWLSWSASESFEGISTPTPILIVNGRRPGPTLCLTAALHGDELNGVEMVRRIMYSLDPEKLNGAVIGAPIVNLHGFRRSSRYLPDRRDLNRYFPGSPTGSSASRIAHSFFHEIIVHCDALVDVHTGSFHRSNLPQLRADLNIPEVVELTKGFGATVVLHSRGARGTLRRAATDKKIPAVTLEAGEPMRLQPKEVAHGVKGIETLLDKLGMVKKTSFWGDPQPVYYESRWIRVNTGGILFSNVNLGERVRKDEVLGTVTDPITNKRSQIVSPWDGRIIGRALNQVVMPGFAAFHVGIQTSEEEIHQNAPDVADASDADEESEDGEDESGARAEDSAPPSDAGDEHGGDAEFLEEDERPE